MTQAPTHTHSLPARRERSTPDFARICTVILFTLGAYAGLATIAANVLLRAAEHYAAINPIRVTLLYYAMCLHGVVAMVALLAALSVRRRRVGSPLAAKLLLAVAVIFAIVSLDQFVGVIYPPPDRLDSVVQPHATRGWSHRPSAIGSYCGVEVRINSLGLRDRELPVRKPHGEFRILFIGDSMTVGAGLPAEDTFVRRVEPLLNEKSPGRAIRTINAGCSGYTTWQETDFLREEGLRLSPDLVVLGFCINDMMDVIDLPPGGISGKPWAAEYPPLNHFSGLARMAAHFYDAHRARIIRDRQLWTNHNIFDDPKGEIRQLSDVFRDPPLPRVAAAWERTFHDLGEFGQACSSARTPWVLLSFPVTSELPADQSAIRVSHHVRDWARDHGVLSLDVTPAFEQWMTQTQSAASSLFIDHIHPSAEGSRVIARELATFLQARNLLPSLESHPASAPP